MQAVLLPPLFFAWAGCSFTFWCGCASAHVAGEQPPHAKSALARDWPNLQNLRYKRNTHTLFMHKTDVWHASFVLNRSLRVYLPALLPIDVLNVLILLVKVGLSAFRI